MNSIGRNTDFALNIKRLFDSVLWLQLHDDWNSLSAASHHRKLNYFSKKSGARFVYCDNRLCVNINRRLRTRIVALTSGHRPAQQISSKTTLRYVLDTSTSKITTNDGAVFPIIEDSHYQSFLWMFCQDRIKIFCQSFASQREASLQLFDRQSEDEEDGWWKVSSAFVLVKLKPSRGQPSRPCGESWVRAF